MKKRIILLSAASLLAAQTVQTQLQIDGNPGVYSVNNADIYAWKTRTDVYSFQYTKVAEISHILKECLSPYGKIQINDQMNMVVITEEKEKLANVLALCKSLDIPDMKEFVKLKTETISLNYAVPSDISGYLQNYLSIDGSIQTHNALNLLIVHDHDDIIARIKDEIKKFDMAPREIRLEFDIVEVINSDFKDNGINWDELFSVVSANAYLNVNKGSDNADSKNKNSTTSGGVTSSSSTSAESEGNGDSWEMNSAATLSTANFKKFMRFMVENGSANNVSHNSLSILNNHTTTFSYSYEGKSVNVEVKPNLLNEELVKLDLNLSIDQQSIYRTTMYTKVGSSKKLVSFQSADTAETMRKVPGLGTVLPFLFSRDEKGKNNLSLDIVVSASL